jgi:hypothetical protein
MSKIFVKSSDLKLVNGGYCVVGKEQTPVFNAEFMAVQKHAEWVVTFAEKAKGKDFEGKKADSIADVKAEVAKALASKKLQYVTPPTKVKGDLTDKLKAEALAFINFNGETTKVEKINEFLQGFNILQEFEEFGLYFSQDICKLNKVYSMKEVIEAVTSVIDLLN